MFTTKNSHIFTFSFLILLLFSGFPTFSLAQPDALFNPHFIHLYPWPNGTCLSDTAIANIRKAVLQAQEQPTRDPHSLRWRSIPQGKAKVAIFPYESKEKLQAYLPTATNWEKMVKDLAPIETIDDSYFARWTSASGIPLGWGLMKDIHQHWVYSFQEIIPFPNNSPFHLATPEEYKSYCMVYFETTSLMTQSFPSEIYQGIEYCHKLGKWNNDLYAPGAFILQMYKSTHTGPEEVLTAITRFREISHYPSNEQMISDKQPEIIWAWKKRRFKYLDPYFATHPGAIDTLKAACQAAMQHPNYFHELVDYCERYIGKEEALKLMQMQRFVYSCMGDRTQNQYEGKMMELAGKLGNLSLFLPLFANYFRFDFNMEPRERLQPPPPIEMGKRLGLEPEKWYWGQIIRATEIGRYDINPSPEEAKLPKTPLWETPEIDLDGEDLMVWGHSEVRRNHIHHLMAYMASDQLDVMSRWLIYQHLLDNLYRVAIKNRSLSSLFRAEIKDAVKKMPLDMQPYLREYENWVLPK